LILSKPSISVGEPGEVLAIRGKRDQVKFEKGSAVLGSKVDLHKEKTNPER
jgi:hypothetical protein